MRLLSIWSIYAIALSLALARKGARPQLQVSNTSVPLTTRKVLIVGASGATGGQLVTRALERGYEVTAFVRNPAGLPSQDQRLRILQGDVLDYRTVEAAVQDQDAVLCALGHRRYFGPTRILSEGTRNILTAMETHGVRRFVCVTSLGLGDSAGRLGIYYTFLITPLVLPFYFWDKARQEQLIAGSSLDWTIVRPGMLNNRPARRQYRHGPRVGNYILSVRISRADVADFILSQLADNTYLRSATGVCW